MTTAKKKTVDEKIKEADISLSSRRFSQEFVSLFSEQKELLVEVENLFKEKYDITGRGRVIATLCKFALSEIKEQSDVKES
jgi:hypothetical protein